MNMKRMRMVNDTTKETNQAAEAHHMVTRK